jgi:hypothetical protein
MAIRLTAVILRAVKLPGEIEVSEFSFPGGVGLIDATANSGKSAGKTVRALCPVRAMTAATMFTGCRLTPYILSPSHSQNRPVGTGLSLDCGDLDELE